jgi:hypothetical protein
MRTSLMTRSVISIASLAIGSVTLGAAPASADTSSGISRETVLTVASNVKFGVDQYGPATQALVEKVCGFDSNTGRDIQITASYDDEGVNGFLVQAYVDGRGETSSSNCTFAAFAASEPFSTMSGTATIETQAPPVTEQRAAVPATHDYSLSGDVYVSTPVTDIGYGDFAIAKASGNVTRTEAARTTTSRVVTPKTTAVKVAARKAYQRTIDTAQVKLVKALKKAGKSSSKKAAARATYAARKKAAKAKLHIAWLGDKKTVVTTVPTGSSVKPFTFTTNGNNFPF